MALPTYLELVNAVLVRMREEEVTDVASDEYARLIGSFVNDAKRQCEDAHDWSAYIDDIVIATVPDQGNYSLTNTENRVKIDTVVNNDAPSTMLAATRSWINRQMQLGTTPNSRPTYWANNGTDSNGDAVISVFPVPSATEQITITGWVRPGDLTDNGDTLGIPKHPVFELALAMAVRERGEVGGTSTAEYFELAKRALSDAIAYDAARNEDEDIWEMI